jgi:hypothetical protein
VSSVHRKPDNEEKLTTYEFREVPEDASQPNTQRPEPSKKDRWDRLMRMIDR